MNMKYGVIPLSTGSSCLCLFEVQRLRLEALKLLCAFNHQEGLSRHTALAHLPGFWGAFLGFGGFWNIYSCVTLAMALNNLHISNSLHFSFAPVYNPLLSSPSLSAAS